MIRRVCFCICLVSFAASASVYAAGDSRTGEQPEWIDGRLKPLDVVYGTPFVQLSETQIARVDGNKFQTSSDGARSWSDPIEIVKNADEAAVLSGDGVPRNPAQILRTRGGTLIVVWMQIKVLKWDPKTKDVLGESTGGLWSIRSVDGGKTWIDRRKLFPTICGHPPISMIQTTGGRIVVTCQPMLPDPGRNVTCTFVSADEGKTWRRSNIIDLGGSGHHDGAFEATIVELKDGRLWMLMRTNWDKLWEAFSDDDGLSWRTIRPSRFDASSSPAYITRLASGRLAMMWNRLYPQGETSYARSQPAGQGSEAAASWHREELSLAFSDDEGKTWSKPILVARDNEGISYPYLFEHKPRQLWIFAKGNDGCRLRVSAREADLIGSVRMKTTNPAE